MADYPTVDDPFNPGERAPCHICRRGMYRDESRAADDLICSDYCLGRHDERRGAPITRP